MDRGAEPPGLPPPRFLLSVQASRGLTHTEKLLQRQVWIPRIAAGWHELGGRRAVLPAQPAPGHQRDDDLRWWADAR